MASGISALRYGAVIGTGADIDVRGEVGFRPRWVRILNIAGLAIGEWVDGMADAEVLKTITAGTISNPTTLGITPLADGFRIGADTDLNVDGELIRWIVGE
ncbi:hypothetical protein LCGC14_0716460 [marine sediment metagenome]|uniref:Uncharacterized protein n=1 Tax=marine sediment metagenome TaxID=412755 RepID=A0A0F9QI00_9ZZZZ